MEVPTQIIGLVEFVLGLVAVVVTVGLFLFRSGRNFEQRIKTLTDERRSEIDKVKTELRGEMGGFTPEKLEAAKLEAVRQATDKCEQKHDVTMEALKSAMAAQRNEYRDNQEVVHDRITKLQHSDKNRAQENAALHARLESLPTMQAFTDLSIRVEAVAAGLEPIKESLNLILESFARERENKKLENS